MGLAWPFGLRVGHPVRDRATRRNDVERYTRGVTAASLSRLWIRVPIRGVTTTALPWPTGYRLGMLTMVIDGSIEPRSTSSSRRSRGHPGKLQSCTKPSAGAEQAGAGGGARAADDPGDLLRPVPVRGEYDDVPVMTAKRGEAIAHHQVALARDDLVLGRWSSREVNGSPAAGPRSRPSYAPGRSCTTRSVPTSPWANARRLNTWPLSASMCNGRTGRVQELAAGVLDL